MYITCGAMPTFHVHTSHSIEIERTIVNIVVELLDEKNTINWSLFGKF